MSKGMMLGGLALVVVAVIVIGFVVIPMLGGLLAFGDMQVQFYDEEGRPLAWINTGGASMDDFDVTITWTTTTSDDIVEDSLDMEGSVIIKYVEAGYPVDYATELFGSQSFAEALSGSKTYTYSLVTMLSAVPHTDGSSYEIQITGTLQVTGQEVDTLATVTSEKWIKTIYFTVTWQDSKLLITGDVVT